MSAHKKLFGECLCGKVSWSMFGPFDFFGLCQCSLCRKLTGSALASNIFVKFDQFEWISGKENIFNFDMPKPSNFISASCKTCGSRAPRIFGRSKKRVLIPLGSTVEIPEIEPTLVCHEDHTNWFVDLRKAIGN